MIETSEIARVLPSRAVELIDELFDWANLEQPDPRPQIDSSREPLVSAILEHVDRIPPELIRLPPQHYTEFSISRATIRAAVSQWEQGDRKTKLYKIPGFSQANPVAVLRNALARCPDEAPEPSTPEIEFVVDDEELRENLRIDYGAANRALSNGEWKAATVLAGSVLEALLLWSLQQVPAEGIESAKRELNIKGEPEGWGLHPLIKATERLELIRKETASQCHLAKDARNLIHPGRAIRLAQTCNSGTAFSTKAAVEHVLNDLSRKPGEGKEG